MQRVSELTPRDCGELKHNKPRIYITPLTWEIKRLWAAGHKQGEIVKMTGAKIDYVKKITACFSRALNIPYPGFGEGQSPEKEVQQTPKKQPKKTQPKRRKSLTVNFQSPTINTPYHRNKKILPIDAKNIPKGAMAIPLTKGHFAIVDEGDFELVSKYNWFAVEGRKTVYAWCGNINGKRVAMHRLLLGLSDPKIECDHQNGRGYDNRRKNLRVATHAENQRNQGPNCKNTSGFKGVSWKKKDQRWRAQIKVNGKRIHLGQFIRIKDAAEAYNLAAKIYHREYASLNEI